MTGRGKGGKGLGKGGAKRHRRWQTPQLLPRLRHPLPQRRSRRGKPAAPVPPLRNPSEADSSENIRDGQQRYQGDEGAQRIFPAGDQEVIAAQYKVDAEKLAPFIRKYLKSAVESGALIQTKGKGASGSFKLESKSAASKKPAGAVGKAAGKAPAAAAKAKKATAPLPAPRPRRRPLPPQPLRLPLRKQIVRRLRR
ncbi:hypothetical protein PYW07_001909 [Mythimna separata]|uniref:H15 domain-containing protein n=1 Tax=Mythimna separata TaxID=271217 RepID=A0AAD8DWA5_MYTSE|nr:hypothetical protein PYW07_001909 [Mythimna separata]